MLRSIFCVLTIVALAFSPALLQAEDKKQDQDRPKAKKQDDEKKAKAEKKPKANKAAKAKKHPMAAGVVKAVDADAKTITITKTNKKQNTSEDKVFTVADNAKVMIRGEAKTLADVIAGAKARLKLSDDGQKVVGIQVGHAKKKNKKAA